jgi:hypothetical protein
MRYRVTGFDRYGSNLFSRVVEAMAPDHAKIVALVELRKSFADAQQRQPQHTPDIGLTNFFGFGDLGDRRVRAVLQLFAPHATPGRSFDLGLVPSQLYPGLAIETCDRRLRMRVGVVCRIANFHERPS